MNSLGANLIIVSFVAILIIYVIHSMPMNQKSEWAGERKFEKIEKEKTTKKNVVTIQPVVAMTNGGVISKTEKKIIPKINDKTG